MQSTKEPTVVARDATSEVLTQTGSGFLHTMWQLTQGEVAK